MSKLIKCLEILQANPNRWANVAYLMVDGKVVRKSGNFSGPWSRVRWQEASALCGETSVVEVFDSRKNSWMKIQETGATARVGIWVWRLTWKGIQYALSTGYPKINSEMFQVSEKDLEEYRRWSLSN